MGCEFRTEWSRIDSANVKVKGTDSNGFDDGQYNGNKEEYDDQENVEQNVSMYFHLILYIVWPRMSYRDISSVYIG